VTSGGTWVKARGLKERNPFTHRVVQKATYGKGKGNVHPRTGQEGPEGE